MLQAQLKIGYKAGMIDRVFSGNAPRLVLMAAALLLMGWAGMLGWWRYGPDMVLALAAGSLSLCF